MAGSVDFTAATYDWLIDIVIPPDVFELVPRIERTLLALEGVDLVKAGKAVPLFALGVFNEKGDVVRDPNFKDLPSFPEAYELMHGKKPSGQGYEAWKALLQMGIMANKALFLAAGYVVILLSTNYIAEGDYAEGEYYFLLLASILGMTLMASARDLDGLVTMMDEMVAEWLEGDADGLAEIMNRGLTDPVVAAALLYQRNERWAEWIDERMDEPGAVFIAVGAGHLAGEQSVQDYLRSRDIEVTRVQ